MRRLKGKAVIETTWDVEILTDLYPRDDEIQKATREAINAALLNETLATRVTIKSLEMNITEEG